MKKLTQLQPATMGFGLFGIATALLIAMIITGHIGLISLTLALGHVAQPACSAAIAVLMYLAIITRRSERSLEN